MKVPLLENTWILLFAVSATYTLPDGESTAMLSGNFSEPLPLPPSNHFPFPNFDMKVPLLENTWILLFAVSATYTLPDGESTAMLSGNFSEPLPLPPSNHFPFPNFDMKVPLLENTWILLFAVSATYTLPDGESTAMLSGDLKVPLRVPYSPHFDMKVPLLENTWILLFAVSATYTLPS